MSPSPTPPPSPPPPPLSPLPSPPPPPPPPPPPAADSGESEGKKPKSAIIGLLQSIHNNTLGIVVVLTMGVFLYILYGTLTSSPPGTDLLGRLRDTEVARGLITFVISMSTIILGFILVAYALFSTANADESRFRHGREVFTGLMGVLGTIVGFYFGATQQGGRELELAPLDVVTAVDNKTRTVVTHVSGGTPPYRYAVRFPGATGKDVADKTADNGWVREVVPEGAGDRVRVEVTDRTNRQTSVEASLKKADEKAGTKATEK